MTCSLFCALELTLTVIYPCVPLGLATFTDSEVHSKRSEARLKVLLLHTVHIPLAQTTPPHTQPNKWKQMKRLELDRGPKAAFSLPEKTNCPGEQLTAHPLPHQRLPPELNSGT